MTAHSLFRREFTNDFSFCCFSGKSCAKPSNNTHGSHRAKLYLLSAKKIPQPWKPLPLKPDGMPCKFAIIAKKKPSLIYRARDWGHFFPVAWKFVAGRTASAPSKFLCSLVMGLYMRVSPTPHACRFYKLKACSDL